MLRKHWLDQPEPAAELRMLASRAYARTRSSWRRKSASASRRPSAENTADRGRHAVDRAAWTQPADLPVPLGPNDDGHARSSTPLAGKTYSVVQRDARFGIFEIDQMQRGLVFRLLKAAIEHHRTVRLRVQVTPFVPYPASSRARLRDQGCADAPQPIPTSTPIASTPFYA